MRSLRAIQSSACSWRGMPSHLFSMLASVGLEMAWVEAARRMTAEWARRPVRARETVGRNIVSGFMCRRGKKNRKIAKGERSSSGRSSIGAIEFVDVAGGGGFLRDS